MSCNCNNDNISININEKSCGCGCGGFASASSGCIPVYNPNPVYEEVSEQCVDLSYSKCVAFDGNSIDIFGVTISQGESLTSIITKLANEIKLLKQGNP